jgi:hypothetical protein
MAMTRSPFSIKGLLIGAAMSLAVGLAAPYGLALEYFRMGFNPSSQGAIFFFISLLVVNILFGLVRRQFTLSRADLVLVYCMLLMAVTVPTWGLMFFLLGTMVYPYYYATPENGYAELFHDHIPSWMVPQDLEAISHYYEGLPKGATINWWVWIEPLAYWFSLIMAMGFMLFCVSSILHRQWSVHERLAYPMLQLPNSMIEKGEGAFAAVAPLFRNKIMWIGFLIPMIYFSCTGLHHFYPSVPEFSFWLPGIRLFRDTVSLPIAFSYAWVGFFYLVNLEISFSIWFFYVFCKFEDGLFSILGISSTEKLSGYEASQSADLTHQATGAVIVFVLFVLWSARGHLVDVLRKVWNPDSGIDDSEELLRYRTAAIGFGASFSFIAFWLWLSGVPPVFLPVIIIVSLIFLIWVARAVATSGVATARSPIVPAYFAISGFGTSALGAKGLVALDFTFVWQGESRTSPMVACAHGIKLAESIKGSKTRLFWGMMIALALSFTGAAFMTIYVCHTYGAINLSHINWAGAHGWPGISRLMTELPDANMRGWLFRVIGGLGSGFLSWAQHRWFWWPLHPLGFALSVGWLAGHIWFTSLVAWLIKLAIMHFGGIRLYQSLKPFFLGLILGEVSVNGLWGFIFWMIGERGRILSYM